MSTPCGSAAHEQVPADDGYGSSPALGARASTSWAPVAALSSGIAALVTSEFLPAGVLPAMAADLHVSEGVAGLAVAATALAGAATAPSIAVVLPRTDRRRVLLGFLACATVSDVIVAAAPSFPALLLARLLLGVAIAGYWSFAFGAGTWARPGRDHVVSTALVSGGSVATVAGLPIGSLAGDALGWRAVFAVAAVLTALSTAAVRARLPSVPAQPSAGLRMLRSALANRRLMAGVGATMIVVLGNFGAYPYIRVAIDDVAPHSTSLLLLAWGVAGLAGTLAAGGQFRRLRFATAVAPLLLAGGLALATARTTASLTAGILLWGFAFNAVPVLTQLWVTRAEPEHRESAMSLQVTAFQVAISLGAVVGGSIVDAHGARVALALGAACAASSALVFALLRVPRPASS